MVGVYVVDASKAVESRSAEAKPAESKSEESMPAEAKWAESKADSGQEGKREVVEKVRSTIYHYNV